MRSVLRVGLVLALAATAALALGVAPAAATDECQGLQICVPVAGPWVVVPTAGGASRASVEYRLSCPKGFVVGGTDVELSDPAVDVTFLGRSGSPVNPGITTERAAVFVGMYVGNGARVVTFRPHVGCIPLTGGGGRYPTAVRVFPVGHPTIWRVREVRLVPGFRHAVQGCAAAERLVGSSYAVAFYQANPPSAALVASVRATRSVRAGKVVAVARSTAAVSATRAVLQVGAVCAGGT